MEGRRIKYPIDTASFNRIREEGYLYVDKTAYIDKLVNNGIFYFLARPRRFGKSLFIDVLQEYFQGNRNLFKGLEIERLQPGEWESFPVLRFNLSGMSYMNSDNLKAYLNYHIDVLEKEYGLYKENTYSQPDIRFLSLITNVSKKSGKKVVILIDEYDNPLTASIGKPELQENFREQLHGFYSTLKKTEENIKFCFLTGVTRFGKVSVFSGLNNLNDITFSNDYASICGITKDELSLYYNEGIQQFADKEGVNLEKAYQLLRYYYDGYHFSSSLTDIYNPFSINHVMAHKELKDYWCQSGVPTLLSKSLMENEFNVEKLAGMKVEESELIDLSMFKINPVPLFYQTGYLTLKDYDPKRRRFTLGYPNREVETGILRNILNFYSEAKTSIQNTVFNLEDALEEGDPKKFVKILSSFLSDIPLDLRNNVSKYENYYHTIFYCIIKLIGLDISAEYATSEGYIDILIKTDEYIYVIELKVNGTAEDAINQIEEKNYCAPFESEGRKLFKIGIGFSKVTGSIASSIVK